MGIRLSQYYEDDAIGDRGRKEGRVEVCHTAATVSCNQRSQRTCPSTRRRDRQRLGKGAQLFERQLLCGPFGLRIWGGGPWIPFEIDLATVECRLDGLVKRHMAIEGHKRNERLLDEVRALLSNADKLMAKKEYERVLAALKRADRKIQCLSEVCEECEALAGGHRRAAQRGFWMACRAILRSRAGSGCCAGDEDSRQSIESDCIRRGGRIAVRSVRRNPAAV